MLIEKREQQGAYIQEPCWIWPFVFTKARNADRDKRGASVLRFKVDTGTVRMRLPNAALVIELLGQNEPESAFA